MSAIWTGCLVAMTRENAVRWGAESMDCHAAASTKAGGAPWHCNSPKGIAIEAIHRAEPSLANPMRILQHRFEYRLNCPGELLMISSTSAVAVCCSRLAEIVVAGAAR